MPHQSLRRLTLAALAAGSLGAIVPAAAQADSIVYLKDGNVWIARGDGSGARQFTLHPYNWSSPSAADDGTVVVAGGAIRVNLGGTDSDGGSELYRFSADGNQIGSPIPTWGSQSSPACPTYGPNSVRVSPDGTKIAYGILECGDPGYTTMWTPSTATGLEFPGQRLGQTDYYEPSWIDSSRFVVSHAGMTVTDTQGRWGVHDVGGADGSSVGSWSEPAMTGTGAQGLISRDGHTFAVFEDDASDYTDARPRNVRLWLYTSPGAGLPGAGQGWNLRCKVALDAASTSKPLRISPSFSPDGAKLVWGDDRGVEVAPVGDLSNCAAVAPQLLIAGGSEPFYAKADVRAQAPHPRQPGGDVQPQRPRAAFAVKTRRPRAHHRITFDGGASRAAGGAIRGWSWTFGDGGRSTGRRATHLYKRPGTYTVTLTVRDGAGTTAAVRHRIRVKR